MSDTSVLLKEMAKLTLYSGKINEIQIKNLKIYPFVMFENVSKDSTLEYDFTPNTTVEYESNRETLETKFNFKHEEKKSGWVDYRLVSTGSFYEKNEFLDKRYLALESAVRLLFWNDVEVRIFVDNKIVYGDPNVRK